MTIAALHNADLTREQRRDTIRWLAENDGKMVELTEADKLRLFGSKGRNRNTLLHSYLTYHGKRREWVGCGANQSEIPYRTSPAFIDHHSYTVNAGPLLEEIRLHLQKARTAVVAQVMTVAAETGLTPDEVYDMMVGRGPLQLSHETQQLLQSSRSRWSDETLLLVHEKAD